VRVLIADDSSVMRHLIASAVEARGHEPVLAADGDAAWTAYERDHAPLVMLDWQMPNLDGLEVCRRIRASSHARDTFVLVVTGRNGESDIAEALDAGADDYLSKPITLPLIAARLAIAERRIEQSAARWRAEAELAKARWLAGIGQTALAIQHEVNNPLAAMLGNLQLMLMDDALPHDTRQLADAMLEQGRRVANVVRRLSALEDPHTVEYLTGAEMIDLSERGPA
jgi:two-component system, NtrC family, sensor kinase